MSIIGFEIYPTDPLVWLSVDNDKLVKGDYVILRLEDATEESARIVRIEEQENIKKLNDIDENISITGSVQFLRKASENDLQKIQTNQKRVPEALIKCRQAIRDNSLSMQLVTAHYAFSGNQVMFIFTADGRVDFRNLVKDLVRIFKRQVRLKQIGPRDRSRFIGGFGKCGRHLCCATHLEKLDSVTMDMARLQNLHAKGAAKISGICGKLLCCLAYEIKLYQELENRLPAIGKRIEFQGKTGVVKNTDVLNQTLKVEFKNDMADNVPVGKVKVLTS